MENEETKREENAYQKAVEASKLARVLLEEAFELFTLETGFLITGISLLNHSGPDGIDQVGITEITMGKNNLHFSSTSIPK